MLLLLLLFLYIQRFFLNFILLINVFSWIICLFTSLFSIYVNINNLLWLWWLNLIRISLVVVAGLILFDIQNLSILLLLYFFLLVFFNYFNTGLLSCVLLPVFLLFYFFLQFLIFLLYNLSILFSFFNYLILRFWRQFLLLMFLLRWFN